MIGHDRHLTAENLESYLVAGVPVAVPISGLPEMTLQIDPGRGVIGVRTPFTGDADVNFSRYRHLRLTHTQPGGVPSTDFEVVGREFMQAAYPVLTAVADMVQLEQRGLVEAITSVLDRYHEILSGLGWLSREEETGLFGELLVLELLTDTIGFEAAVAAWRGPLSEEHDFDLRRYDVEVKTTISERRRHRIATMTQLVPRPNRRLVVASIQITEAGTSGQTLGDLVTAILDRASLSESIPRFDELLREAGCDRDEIGKYSNRFALRSRPANFNVDGNFPAVNPSRLVAAGISLERIDGVSYTVDLTGLPADAGVPELNWKDHQ